MKVLNWAARTAASSAILCVALASARASDTIRQPESVVQTTFEYDNYLDFASSQTQPPPNAVAQAETQNAAQAPANAADAPIPEAEATTADSPTNTAPPEPKPWQMPQPLWFQKHNIRMGGWIQQGITFNNLTPTDRYNGPVVTNDRDSEYQLNQAWLYFDRPTNTDGHGFDLGGHVDVVYGTDWRFGQNFGLEDRIDDPNSFYGLILPQFYGEVAVNNLTVKMGHFATNTSLEKVPAVANFFYSHSYIMAGYFDPLLVTGFEADYKIGDNWMAVGGMNRGWMMFEDPNDDWNFLGGFRYASDDKRHALSVMVDTGEMVGFTGVHPRHSVIGVYTMNITKKLQYGSQYTVGQEVNGSFVNPGQNADWYGTEQLLTYKLNEKWSAGVRYEWIRDEDGARIAGVGNVLGTSRGWSGLPGFTGSFQDISLGLNYRPNLNWVIRPEARWDMYNGPANPFGQLPYGDLQRSSQFTFACDAIVTF